MWQHFTLQSSSAEDKTIWVDGTFIEPEESGCGQEFQGDVPSDVFRVSPSVCIDELSGI